MFCFLPLAQNALLSGGDNLTLLLLEQLPLPTADIVPAVADGPVCDVLVDDLSELQLYRSVAAAGAIEATRGKGGAGSTSALWERSSPSRGE